MNDVRQASAADAEQIYQVLTEAFRQDPLMRWLLPDSNTYLTWYPKLLQAYAGIALDLKSAWISQSSQAAALWLPPGYKPDETATGHLMESCMDPARLTELDLLTEQIGKYEPDRPHWYLPVIGVSEKARHQGLGSALLTAQLSDIDSTGDLAYLESSNPDNISFYLRHGFKVMGQAQVKSSPVVTCMVRYTESNKKPETLE